MIMISLTGLLPGLSPGADHVEIEKDLVKHLKGIFFSAGKNLYEPHIILRLKEKINLSQQQERKIEKLMLNLQETAIRTGAEIKIEELRLVSYLNSGKTSRKETARRLREIGKKKTAMIVAYMNCLLDLGEILTAKQLQMLREMKKKKKKRYRENLKKTADKIATKP